jgi:hypothetical protein
MPARARCAYCHADLPAIVRECGACGTLIHTDCAHELAVCPTLGCEASLGVARRRKHPPARKLIAVVLGAILMLGLLARICPRPALPVANVLRISTVEWANRRHALALELGEAGRFDEAAATIEELERKWYQIYECSLWEGPRKENFPPLPPQLPDDSYETLGCFGANGEPCDPGPGWILRVHTIERTSTGPIRKLADLGSAIEDLRHRVTNRTQTLSH